MAKSVEHSRDYPVSVDVLLRAVTDPEYLVLREKSHGALKASVKEIERSDARLVYEVHVTNYARGMTGIDRSKTEDSHATYTWDLKARRGDWTYTTVHGNRIKIWGTLRISESRGGARLSNELNAEVKIPLMGKRIEKMIIKGVNDNQPTFNKTLEDFIAQLDK